MVRGLTHVIDMRRDDFVVGISDFKSTNEKKRFVVDGTALAYFVLRGVEGDKHSKWTSSLGGNYEVYKDRLINFFELFKNLEIELRVSLPLPSGTPSGSEDMNPLWSKKAEEKLSKIRLINILSDDPKNNRSFPEIIPPFLYQLIILYVKENVSDFVKVVFTCNNLTRYNAISVVEDGYDAVISDNSDYLIFSNVNYIPIDSIHISVEDDKCKCVLYNSKIVCQAIGLEKEEHLFQLSVILGNYYTESFWDKKYNAYQLFKIKQNPKYPQNLLEGLVKVFNDETFESIEKDSRIIPLLEEDADFKSAFEASVKHYSTKEPLLKESESEIRKAVDELLIPAMSVSISQGKELWYDPVVDDYEKEFTTTDYCSKIRSFICSLLTKEPVTEYVPRGLTLETKQVEIESSFPQYLDIRGEKNTKKELSYYRFCHALFPEMPKPASDPINNKSDPVKEPFRSMVLALRYILSICYTDMIQEEYRLKKDDPDFDHWNGLKVVGAPPLDPFEIKSILYSVVLNHQLGDLGYKDVRPAHRMIQVQSMYQNTLLHLHWLQQVLGLGYTLDQFTGCYFNGNLFANIYIDSGDPTRFAPRLFTQDVSEVIDQCNTLYEYVLSPFPKELMTKFASVPRCIKFEKQDESALPVIEVHASKFAALASSDDEDGAAEPVTKTVNAPTPIIALPAQQKKKKEAVNEDEGFDFLMEEAAKNEGVERKETVVSKPKKSKPTHKRVEQIVQNQRNYSTRDDKLTAKMQMKQRGYDR